MDPENSSYENDNNGYLSIIWSVYMKTSVCKLLSKLLISQTYWKLWSTFF